MFLIVIFARIAWLNVFILYKICNLRYGLYRRNKDDVICYLLVLKF